MVAANSDDIVNLHPIGSSYLEPALFSLNIRYDKRGPFKYIDALVDRSIRQQTGSKSISTSHDSISYRNLAQACLAVVCREGSSRRLSCH